MATSVQATLPPPLSSRARPALPAIAFLVLGAVLATFAFLFWKRQTPKTEGPAPSATATAHRILAQAFPSAGQPAVADTPPVPIGLEALLRDPEVAAQITGRVRSAVDSRYAGLFAKLNLDANQTDSLKELLVRRAGVALDLLATTTGQGISPRDNPEQFQQLVSQAQTQADASISTLLGETGYQTYLAYNATLPQHAVIDQLGQQLASGAFPLSGTQADMLLPIVTETAPPSSVADPMMLILGGNLLSPPAQITDETIQRAQGVLTPEQLQVLRQIQSQQQASPPPAPGG